MSHLALHGTVSMLYTTCVRDTYNDVLFEKEDVREAWFKLL